MSIMKKPSVLFFVEENTLMAWTRTSSALMTFGFVVERFSSFIPMSPGEEIKNLHRFIPFFVGEVLVLLGVVVALYSAIQYKRFLKTLIQTDTPKGYNVSVGFIVNIIVGVLGIILNIYMALGFF